jgi:hypothetical protein
MAWNMTLGMCRDTPSNPAKAPGGAIPHLLVALVTAWHDLGNLDAQGRIRVLPVFLRISAELRFFRFVLQGEILGAQMEQVSAGFFTPPINHR